jgi:hypothetical protein
MLLGIQILFWDRHKITGVKPVKGITPLFIIASPTAIQI